MRGRTIQINNPNIILTIYEPTNTNSLESINLLQLIHEQSLYYRLITLIESVYR